MNNNELNTNTKTIILAGGCFWCVEADLEKLDGVEEVVSGYSGGKTENPTYENYAQGGHREVGKVTYDPKKITLRQLLWYFLKHIDPTDAHGSFADRGEHYAPAIYYETDEEKQMAEGVLEEIEDMGAFDKPLQVPVLPRETFWPAEKSHQNFCRINPLRYKAYRKGSGREDFIKKYWGEDADTLPAKK